MNHVQKKYTPGHNKPGIFFIIKNPRRGKLQQNKASKKRKQK
jgi:hypothetical protein